jgi:hypothetical protein
MWTIISVIRYVSARKKEYEYFIIAGHPKFLYFNFLRSEVASWWKYGFFNRMTLLLLLKFRNRINQH